MEVEGKRLILVVGKGGVGRSTVAAALANNCARSGRRTLLFEADANDRFADLFSRSTPVSTEIVALAPNVHAVNTNPSAALEEYGLMVLHFKRVYRLVFENRITKYFLRAIPGLDDYSILGKAWFHTREEKSGRPAWDTVVFDMPASGHSLSMLRLPRAIVETVPEGPLTRDARSIRSLLADPARCAIVLVTLAEEMPANEAVELAASLHQELGRPVDQVVVNQVYPDLVPENSPTLSAIDIVCASLTDTESSQSRVGTDLRALALSAKLLESRRRLNEVHLARLAQTMPCPLWHLPRLFVPVVGPPELAILSEALRPKVTHTRPV